MKTIVTNVEDALGALKIAKFMAIFEVGPDGLQLPPYKGATFRGSFGHVLAKMACHCPKNENGRVVKHQKPCVFGYIFETEAHEDPENGVLKHNQQLPRPFILEPPMEQTTEYAPGERIMVGFSLIGEAIPYTPYFIYALDEMGKRGLGRQRKPIYLRQIFALDENDDFDVQIYHADTRLVKNEYPVITGRDILQSLLSRPADPYPGNRIRFHFLTPTRLKHQAEYVQVPEFHIVVRSVIRRITALLYYHQGIQIKTDFSEMIHRAHAVHIVRENVRWIDWERYSNRQQERLKMGGIVGDVTYQGDIQPFLPWLRLAEWTNIGKHPNFGLGKIKTIFPHA